VLPCNQSVFFLLSKYFISGIQQEDSFTDKLGLTLRKKLMKWCILRIALYGAETRTLRKIGQKYLESFEMLRKDGEDQLGRSREK